jgi:hypothetical protein
METKAKIEEAFEILTEIMRTKRYPAIMCRAHRLLESALGDFFSEDDDVAALGQCFPDHELVGELLPEPPFPAA